MKSITNATIALLLLALLQLSVVIHGATVSYVTTAKGGTSSQRNGSTEGGTLLWVYGTGFARTTFSTEPSDDASNSVKLVNGSNSYACNLQSETGTETQLACYTTRVPVGDYLAQVYVQGRPIPLSQYSNPSIATFLARSNNTPQISVISPASGKPQRMVSLSGDFKTNCYLHDDDGCRESNVSVISRVYVGGQSCDLVDSERGEYYSNLSNTDLQCHFKSDEVGIFNVTMLVSNNNGRSSSDSSLYRMSGTGQMYHFETYAVLNNVSTSSGSVEGGTILTIQGDHFVGSSENPLVVNVGDEPCNVLSSKLTTIQCQTSLKPNHTRNYYHGGRGLHVYQEPGFISLRNLGNATPPMPNPNTTGTWQGEASFSANFPQATTVWFRGFIRPPMPSAYYFQLETNADAILYLSTDEDPANKVRVASTAAPSSSRIVLQNDTDYYMLCVASTRGGSFNLAVDSAIQPVNSRTGASSAGTSEIQQISIGAPVSYEHQRITYLKNSSVAGRSEVQDVEAVFQIFQIGFDGVYTVLLDGPPTPAFIQDALNDLPTIFPFSVTVALVGTAYRVTFPVEMGNVPLLTVISSAYNHSITAVEIVQGITSASQIAFTLDRATTNYMDFINDNITDAILTDQFMNLFNIRCPPSLNNPQVSSSIVYADDFEDVGCSNDTLNIIDMAFCGCGALKDSSQYLVTGNNQVAAYMCLAYKVVTGGSLTLNFLVVSDSNPPVLETIPQTITADSLWHYNCIDLLDMLVQYDPMYMAVTTFTILQVNISYFTPLTIMIDTVTLRTDQPIGYEDSNILTETDISGLGPCTFPFNYNGQNYFSCVLDDQNQPICGLTNNTRLYCQNSSIEGVRRLFPKYQMLRSSFQVTHVPAQQTIDISFRYAACMSPSLISVVPPNIGQVTSISNASKAIGGYYSIMFDGKVYSPIPVAIDGSNLANIFQSFSDFGFVDVTRAGDCNQYAYTIQWLANGEQPLITIQNASQVTPVNTPMSISSIQHGTSTNVFYNLPTDVLRTYHTTPQVEVLVGGYSTYCSQDENNCEFQVSPNQTPQITSVQQSGASVTIHGSGFSSQPESNMVLIGETGTCTVQTASPTQIVCTLANAPSGQQSLRLNIADKGIASCNQNLTVNVPLTIVSFDPSGGNSGGGYMLTVTGSGFSSNAIVKLGEHFCLNLTVISFTAIQCTVPPSDASSLTQVTVTTMDGLMSTTATNRFTYNVTSAPTITSISPTSVTMSGGQLQINGAGFGFGNIAVFIGTKKARLLASTNNYILVSLSSLPPGLYPIIVNTSSGCARPLFYIEYQFYVQEISPKVGSAYGGTDVYLNGVGFENQTLVQLRDDDNQISPCNIISLQSNQIHCQTTVSARQVNITSFGTHPIYGFGYSWYPIRETVEQGTTVMWYWDSSQLSSPVYYKVQQVENAYSTTPVSNGFDSGTVSTSGSFSYRFDTLGTFYYWAPNVNPSTGYSMRAAIDVIPLQSKTVTIEATSNTFTAQTCSFPFIFNSVNYTACTTTNDTQPWCSPTPAYTGQRLYCTPAVPIPSPSCSSTTLNANSCGETIPTSSSPGRFLTTTCMVESVTSISPTQGPAGTELIITGTNFNGSICDYDIQIGPSYHCPIVNMSSSELRCQITTRSMLDPRTIYMVRVVRAQQGYLASQSQLQFQFLPSISNITPTIGSIYGGTFVTIDGDGFISGVTLVSVPVANFTYVGPTSYSQMNFTTPLQSQFVDVDLNLFVVVYTTPSECLLSSCHFAWTTQITPYFDSVSPPRVRGPTNLNITGRNLLSGGGTVATTHVTVNDNPCNITQMQNDMILCTVMGVEAGDHPIVGSIDGVGDAYSSANITSDAYISAVAPLTGSIHGGATLTIDGHGFSKNISSVQVNIDSNPCSVTETSDSQVKCTIPPQNNSTNTANITITSEQTLFPTSLTFSYNRTITPNISSVSPTLGSGSQVLHVTGNNLNSTRATSISVGNTPCNVSSHSMTSVTCTVSSDLPAGNHTVRVNIDDVGDSNDDVQYQHDLTVTNVTPSEGGYGGGVKSTINGNGFNRTNVNVSVCNISCVSVQIISNRQLNCETPPMPMTSASTLCNVSVKVDDIQKQTSFTYKSNLTATITSVAPNRGGTGGGTTIIINGTNFPTNINAVSVTIGGVPCFMLSVSQTSIMCQTGGHPDSSVQAPILVAINGSGYAVGSVYFEYMDLWSSQWTWGGDDPPEEGTLVQIDSQHTIYLDMVTPVLKVLIIDNATVIFDDNQDVTLNVEYIIIINGGRLIVGTESNPFQHRGVITMYGHLRSIELPIYGAKVLALREGTLDMHGIPTIQTWAQLATTANNGSSTITLIQPVNWTIGSQIIIATTSDRFSQRESEIRQITNISSNGLIL
ncbi:unnamed protein product, partial [Rotaria magnacalcarata]